jgi:hypothetical protein
MMWHITLLGYWKVKWWDTMLLTWLSGRAKLILCNSAQVAAEVERFFDYEFSHCFPDRLTQSIPLARRNCPMAGRYSPGSSFPTTKSSIGISMMAKARINWSSPFFFQSLPINRTTNSLSSCRPA